MKLFQPIRNERGIALITVMLVSFVVAALVVGATLLSTNADLILRYSDRQTQLGALADGGIEQWRSKVNADKTLYPDSGYKVLENGVTVVTASGATIPNIHRWTYVGPTGLTSGEYGVFGSVVSVVKDDFGNTEVRRGEIIQESFAKYAYFTDIEPSNIFFGNGDQIWGPVHTNDVLKIMSTGARFHSYVETALTVSGANYGTFDQGYKEHAAPVPMPATANLTKLLTQATAGGTNFTGTLFGSLGLATTRIEFVPVDLNADGKVNGPDEGFIMVYKSVANPAFVVADRPAVANDSMKSSLNCGHLHAGVFVSARAHTAANGTNVFGNGDTWKNAVSTTGATPSRCYLGGADILSGNVPGGVFTPVDAQGAWTAWPGAVDPRLVAKVGALKAGYMFPITRALNPNFKGVIYIAGDVAVSGQVRGQVTLAASGDIVIADDITYVTSPGAGTCNDILGLFAGQDVVVADNTLNSPQLQFNGGNMQTYDDTKDEFIQGILLALANFTVENYDQGSTNAEACETTTWGRGCLYLTGGIIQNTRGAVGVSNGTGYIKRYSYDQCAFSSPPPYFPTTGRFSQGRYFEVDPTSFDVNNLYHFLTPH